MVLYISTIIHGTLNNRNHKWHILYIDYYKWYSLYSQNCQETCVVIVILPTLHSSDNDSALYVNLCPLLS